MITGLNTFLDVFLLQTPNAGAADQYWHAEVMMGLTLPVQMVHKCCGGKGVDLVNKAQGEVEI